MSVSADIDNAPGSVCKRSDVPVPEGYAVFDCETTGVVPGMDEIVAFAVVRLDSHGVETTRYALLVRPLAPIPVEASSIHGITDEDVADAPRFAEIAFELRELLAGAVFVAHNAPFDLAMLQHAFAKVGIEYCPAGVACTLDGFRLLEPLAVDHRLRSICERHGIALAAAHDALNDALSTAAVLRVLLAKGIAPESIKLDQAAFLRLRSRGDSRPASEPQIRRVFGMARSAGLLCPDGSVDRAEVVALVGRVAGTDDVDSLTREAVQDVYDELERLIAALTITRAA
jgi:DNA polymerase III epsilon subunit family exonuclease